MPQKLKLLPLEPTFLELDQLRINTAIVKG
jgi:hypothetical protein